MDTDADLTRTLVIVEGASDRLALEVLARRLGRNLAAPGGAASPRHAPPLRPEGQVRPSSGRGTGPGPDPTAAGALAGSPLGESFVSRPRIGSAPSAGCPLAAADTCGAAWRAAGSRRGPPPGRG